VWSAARDGTAWAAWDGMESSPGNAPGKPRDYSPQTHTQQGVIEGTEAVQSMNRAAPSA